MKTLGIFGDSWADPRHGHDLDPSMDQDAWLYHLGDYELMLHSATGSSLYWAYEQFIEHYEKYDKCIFVATAIRRLPVNTVREINGPKFHVANYDMARHILETNARAFDIEKRKWLEALMGYYLFLQDDQFDIHMARLIIEDIRRLRPDTIIVPILPQPKILDDVVPLNEYRRTMFNSIDSSKTNDLLYGTWNYKEANLTCHVSKQMNQFIAQDMRQALATGVWDPKIPEYVPHERGLDWYYDLKAKVT